MVYVQAQDVVGSGNGIPYVVAPHVGALHVVALHVVPQHVGGRGSIRSCVERTAGYGGMRGGGRWCR